MGMTHMEGVDNAALLEAWKSSTEPSVRLLIRKSLGTIATDYGALKVELHPADNNTEFQIWRRGRPFEEPNIRHLCRLIEGKDAIVADVGANAGIFSIRFALAAGKGATIHAFEPNPIMLDRLRRNISLNALNTIKVHDCAVADVSGTVRLNIANPNNMGETHITHDGDGAEVAVRPLLSVIKKKIDLLKVDVEGREPAVIRPLLAIAPAKRPTHIYLEASHPRVWGCDLLAEIEAAGYRLARDFKANRLYTNEVAL